VPAEARKAILLDDAALNGELLRMTDAYTDALFPLTPAEAGRVIFPLSRLVCDVELLLTLHLPGRWCRFQHTKRIGAFCL
jgi:hypothetical protein